METFPRKKVKQRIFAGSCSENAFDSFDLFRSIFIVRTSRFLRKAAAKWICRAKSYADPLRRFREKKLFTDQLFFRIKNVKLEHIHFKSTISPPPASTQPQKKFAEIAKKMGV